VGMHRQVWQNQQTSPSPYRLLLWKAMPMAHHTRTPVLCQEILGQLCAPHHQGGVGHNVPQEAPQAFAQAIVDVDGY